MSDSSTLSPEEIVTQLLKNDAFSQWLGVEVIEAGKGACKLRCTVHKGMLNGYKITHGGALFSLADSAIAFASATYGRTALAIDHSISFTKKAVLGDTLTAEAETVSMGRKTGVIQVQIKNQDNELVALIKGTVYRTSERLES